MKNISNKGISAIEVLIVSAIMGVLVAVVALPLISFRKHQALQNSTNAVVAVLTDARTKTLAALNNTSYGVRVESSRVILFTGTTYTSSASTNEVVLLETPVTASWSLQGGGSSIGFDRLTGITSQYGTITLALPDGTTRVVTIAASGSVTRN